jgi:hypothetical protein
VRDVQIWVGKRQLCDPFKAFFQVGLNTSGVFSFRKDLKQLFVRKEKESREVEALLLEVSVQSLQNQFEKFIALD